MYFKNLLLLILFVVTAFCNTGFTPQDEKPEEIVFTREGWHDNGVGNLSATWENEIFKLNLRTLKLSKIADGGNPSVSTDGNTIVYEKMVESPYMWTDDEFYLRQYRDIFITDSEGKSHKNLTNTPYLHERYPKIAPNGKLVSFINEGRDSYGKLCFINIENGVEWCLNDMDAIYDFSCQLPDEEWSRDCLSYEYKESEGIYLNVVDHLWIPYVQDQDLSKSVLLLSSQSSELVPQRQDEIFAVTLVGNAMYDVSLIARGRYPSASPDGTKVFYLNGRSIYVTDIQGAQHEKLIDIKEDGHIYTNFYVHVSNDNRNIAYATTQHIYIANIDGSENRPILWNGGNLYIDDIFTQDGLMYGKLAYGYGMGSLYWYDLGSTKSTRITYAPEEVFGGADYGAAFIP